MDLKNIFRFVAPQIREAALKTAAQLEHLGIRHALVGGLAVGAHGYVRATTDVNFLVGEEAFEHHGLIVTFRAGVPIEIDNSPYAVKRSFTIVTLSKAKGLSGNGRDS